MLQRIRVLIILMVSFQTSGFAQTHFETLCLSQQELDVATQINAFRVKHNLAKIPLSRSLCYVADVHAKDLYLFYDENGGGSMHSWSDQGRWNECLYVNPRTDGRCMHNKPSELTEYQGLGFELVYYDNTENEDANAMKLWLENGTSKQMILNEGKYVAFDWNAIGVKIFNGYVVVWFGTTTDFSVPIYLCTKVPEISLDSISKTAPPDIHKAYYVVVASYFTRRDAELDKIRWEKRFFEPLKIVENDGKYRLAVGAYNDNAAAEKALKNIKKAVKDAWIISL